jgi:hypothetical protein
MGAMIIAPMIAGALSAIRPKVAIADASAIMKKNPIDGMDALCIFVVISSEGTAGSSKRAHAAGPNETREALAEKRSPIRPIQLLESPGRLSRTRSSLLRFLDDLCQCERSAGAAAMRRTSRWPPSYQMVMA